MPDLAFPTRRYHSFLSILVFAMIMVLLLPGCRRKPSYQADISSVRIEPVEIKRYEKALFTIDPLNLREEIDPYMEDFYLFLGEVIDTEMGQQQLYDYITHPLNREIYNDMMNQWEDLSELEEQLSLAFRYFHYHFPDIPVPQIYSYVSGLNFELPVFYQDDVILIGLDMFLGLDYRGYDRVQVSAFKRVRFQPEAAPVELMRELGAQIQHRGSVMPETMLDFMIFEGKLLYFLDAMFPAFHDSLKIYYTAEHINWARANEGHSWTFILNNEMLYSTDRQLIQKFTGETPFTAPFSSGSAPRMGVYHGWQIVREYMRRNSDVKLQELLFEKHNSREILKGSRYRP